MSIKIVKSPIKKSEVLEIARDGFGDIVKAVVDVEQEIMALGGELHADEETLLMEECNSKRENIWGINIYPERTSEDWIEFDSMINLKPAYGNPSRGVEDTAIKEKIVKVVQKLVSE